MFLNTLSFLHISAIMKIMFNRVLCVPSTTFKDYNVFITYYVLIDIYYWESLSLKEVENKICF